MNDHPVVRWLSELHIDGMYDSPGYLKPWYFTLRVLEEITRSKRYERPVSLLAIDVGAKGRASLENWLSTRLRAMDLLCKDAHARHFALLPETTKDGALEVVRRLSTEIGGASISLATLPEEADMFAELVDSIVVDAAREAA